MKKILIFSLAYYPRVGGAEIAVKEITDRISDIEFHMVTQRFDANALREEKIGNVTVHRIGDGSSYLSKIFFVLRAALYARTLDRTHHFDGVWAMMCYMTFPITLMRLLGRKIPYVLTLQEGDPFEHVFRRPHIMLVMPLLKAGFRNASVVQAISTFLGEWAKRMGSSAAIEIIPNGVDTLRFQEMHSEYALDQVKSELEKKMGDVFLITTSRLVHKNAVDDVIKALPDLPENVRCIVLGTGVDEQKLKKLATKLKVSGRVTFVGHVDHTELPKYLRASDIFIRPSRSEGMGNSFIEAMAAGLPVIATQEGGISDFLFDKERNPDKPVTGFAVDKNSPEQIAGAVQKIMREREMVRSVVATAQALVTEKYDWATVAQAMRTKVFEKLF